eukprot:8489536-Pyramimonas_sp.AAC.1
MHCRCISGALATRRRSIADVGDALGDVDVIKSGSTPSRITDASPMHRRCGEILRPHLLRSHLGGLESFKNTRPSAGQTGELE